MTTANPTFPAAPLPRSVAWLGYGGLLPFLLPALIAPFDAAHGSVWLEIQRAYGAIILSFVGALHWAFAMQPGIADDDRHRHFIWSVVPALIGWLALILPAFTGLLLLLLGVLLSLPIPLTNYLFGGIILVYALALLERDGALMLLAWGIGLVALSTTGVLSGELFALIQPWIDKFF